MVPASQLGNSGLADLAWSLSQHPRTRFAVVVNSGLEGGGAEAAATLSCADGFSWPSNAAVIAGFSSEADAPEGMRSWSKAGVLG